MKKLGIFTSMIILCLVFAVPVMAEQTLAVPVTRTSLDQYRIEGLNIDFARPAVEIIYSQGYTDGEGYHAKDKHSVIILNQFIAKDRNKIIDGADFVIELPVAYQINPATVIIGKFNIGDPSPSATFKEYFELVLNQLAGL